MKENSVSKQLDSLLNALEKQEDFAVRLESPVAAMVVGQSGALCGLQDGTMVWIKKRPSLVVSKFQAQDASEVKCVALEGQKCVSGHEDGVLRIWDVEKAEELARLVGHTKAITCIELTHAGNCISGSEDCTVRLWSLQDLQVLATFEGHTGGVKCMVITPESNCISSGEDGVLRVWSIRERRELAKLEGHTAAVNCMALTADGKCITGSSDFTLRVWDAVSFRELAKLEGHKSAVNLLVTTAEGKCVSASFDSPLKVWDLTKYEEIAKLEGHSEKSTCLCALRDGKCMSGSEDKTLRVWDLTEYKEVAKLDGHSDTITALQSTPDGKSASASLDKTVRLWDLTEFQDVVTLKGHTAAINNVVITQDGRCVSTSDDKTLRVWDLTTFQEIAQLKGHEDSVWSVALTADGRCISGSDDFTLKVWDLQKYEELAHLKGHSSWVLSLVVIDEHSFASGSGDRTIIFWDLQKYVQTRKLEGHTHWVRCLAVTPRGHLVSASNDMTVRLWNLTTYLEEAKMEGHTNTITSLTLLGDEQCATGSDDTTIRLWNLKEKCLIVILEGHTDWVSGLAITANGMLLSSSGDLTIRLWDLSEYGEIAKIEAHSECVKCLVCTRDWRWVTGSRDLTLKVWDLAEYRDLDSLTRFSQKTGCTLTDFEVDLPTPMLLRANIKSFREGSLRLKRIARWLFPVWNFNGLHISACYNRHQRCADYLKMGVPLIRGAFGSPLTISLERKATQCVDVILQHFIDRALVENDRVWYSFSAITEDLSELLTSNSTLLEPFFGILMQPPKSGSLPDFITPTVRLPTTKHVDSRCIQLSDFGCLARGESVDVLVKFLVSLPRWNFISGSASSVRMLKALAECGNKLVLKTEYVKTVIEEKWDRCFPFTLGSTLAYYLMLTSVVGVLYPVWGLKFPCIIFLILNGYFISYEVAQMIVLKAEYLSDAWNYVDLLRGLLSAIWAVDILISNSTEKYLTLLVVMFCFVRGFTFFRSFKMTRIFVYMTLSVVQDVYSFLVILAYSVFSFGIFTSVLLNYSSAADAWTSAYNLIMGDFDNHNFGTVEWIVFTGATVTNVIIMLNLLISILSEAYGKTLMSMRENDLHQQISLLLEYETLMFWRRTDQQKGTVIVTCKEAESAGDAHEWSGHIVQIISSIKQMVEGNFSKLRSETNRVEAVEKKLENVEESMKEMHSKLKSVDERVSQMQGQLSQILDFLRSK